MSQSLQIGRYRIHHIVDSEDQLWDPAWLIPDAQPALLRDPRFAPPESFDAERGMLRLVFGGHLIEGPDTSILVDCGIGVGKNRPNRSDWHQRTDTSFLDGLRSVGHPAETVEQVVISHAHVDHVGWLTTPSGDGSWQPTFPRATHTFSDGELSYLLSTFPTEPQLNFGSTADSVLPLLDAVRIRRVDDGAELAPGVTVRLYRGHTPGNLAIWVQDGPDCAVICGDTVHHPIQLRYPQWSTRFCHDPEASRAQRISLLTEAAERGAYLVPNHFRIPPSRIRQIDDHFQFID